MRVSRFIKAQEISGCHVLFEHPLLSQLKEGKKPFKEPLEKFIHHQIDGLLRVFPHCNHSSRIPQNTLSLRVKCIQIEPLDDNDQHHEIHEPFHTDDEVECVICENGRHEGISYVGPRPCMLQLLFTYVYGYQLFIIFITVKMSSWDPISRGQKINYKSYGSHENLFDKGWEGFIRECSDTMKEIKTSQDHSANKHFSTQERSILSWYLIYKTE